MSPMFESFSMHNDDLRALILEKSGAFGTAWRSPRRDAATLSICLRPELQLKRAELHHQCLSPISSLLHSSVNTLYHHVRCPHPAVIIALDLLLRSHSAAVAWCGTAHHHDTTSDRLTATYTTTDLRESLLIIARATR